MALLGIMGQCVLFIISIEGVPKDDSPVRPLEFLFLRWGLFRALECQTEV